MRYEDLDMEPPDVGCHVIWFSLSLTWCHVHGLEQVSEVFCLSTFAAR
jgi:hypothetical protein